MFEEVRVHIPFMAPWIECCYGFKPLLHLELGREVPNLLINAWYLDDGTLRGSPDDLCAILAIIEVEGPSRGLRLNRSKSLLYIPPPLSEVVIELNPLPSADPIASRGSFNLLGSPIGPASL